jgi:putative OPT family oligopeptide transporter
VVAGIVCCSAAIAGDCMQNMKVGQILGSTPRRLQIAEFGGVAITALCIPFILQFLHQVYEIGNPATLPAPQAYVMAGVVQSVMTINFWDIVLFRDVKWIMLGLGVIIAIVLLLLEKFKIARISIMAVAIGIYLPITLSIPILIGGLLSHFTGRHIVKVIKKRHGSQDDYKEILANEQQESESRGILFCSGLIAGEALCGVIIALIVLIAGAGAIQLIEVPNMWPGLIIFAYIIGLLGYLVLRGVIVPKDKE